MLHGVHSVARLRHILGEARVVYLQERQRARFRTPEVEGTISGLLTLESGIRLSILHSCELRLKGAVGGLWLHGSDGSIHEDGYFIYARAYGNEPVRIAYPASKLSD